MLNISSPTAPSKKVVYETTDGKSHPDQAAALVWQARLNLVAAFDATPLAASIAALSASVDEKANLRDQALDLLAEASAPKPRKPRTPKTEGAAKPGRKKAVDAGPKAEKKKPGRKKKAGGGGTPPPPPPPAE